MVNSVSFIKDYLSDQEDGICQLITWFLNLVMEKESLFQSGAKCYERPILVKPVETVTSLEFS